MGIPASRLLSLVAAGLVLAATPSAQDAGAEGPVGERRVDSLFEGALTGARDGQGFSETPGLRHLLELIARYSDDELRVRATRDLDVADALARPAAWRGEIVRLRGLVAGLETVRLSAPIGPRWDAYRAIVTEADGSEGVVVDFLLEPPELELQRDVVDFDAVFFRTVRYENRRGELVEAPYLVARVPRRLDVEALPRRTVLDGLGGLVLAAGGVFLVVRVLVQLRRARNERVRLARSVRPGSPRARPRAATSPDRP